MNYVQVVALIVVEIGIVAMLEYKDIISLQQDYKPNQYLDMYAREPMQLFGFMCSTNMYYESEGNVLREKEKGCVENDGVNSQ